MMNFKTVLYLTVLVATSVLWTVPLILSFMLSTLKFRQAIKNDSDKKKVLVTGAPHTKGLQICRILSSAGHEVVLADMKKFKWSASRFSNCVSKWVTLPNITQGDSSEYKSSLISLIESEGVDWWVPVSHTCTAVVDTEVSAFFRNNSKVKVLSIDDVKTAEMLDDKLKFLNEARMLGLSIPQFYKIQSCQDVFALWERGIFTYNHFFLKPLNPYSEDRVCFTRIPDNLQDLTVFLESYKHKISKDSPYFVSEFVKGDEYTGNVIAKNGEILMYVSNPSSPMQIDYQDASHKTKIYEWVHRFVAAKKLSGSLCFDFMEHPRTGEMMGIECNPRLHSSVVLMGQDRQGAANAIYQALEGKPPTVDYSCTNNNLPVTPGSCPAPVYWLYNELAKLPTKEAPAALARLLKGRDAVWDTSDPVPFFLLPHLQLPSQLASSLLTDQQWSIVNFCLGQLR